MALGSVPAAVGGVYVLDLLERATGRDFDELLLTLLAGALLLTGTATLVRSFLKRFSRARARDGAMERRHKVAAVTLGVFVGFVLGVTSAGSGALIAVGLILLFRLVPTRVVGTDVFHTAILLWAASAATWWPATWTSRSPPTSWPARYRAYGWGATGRFGSIRRCSEPPWPWS
jgi:uncharacterized membrane protein YfcA